MVAHHDDGSEYIAVAYSERLAADGIRPSMGVVGSSYDSALAETINVLCKTELLEAPGPWRTVDQVGVATAVRIGPRSRGLVMSVNRPSRSHLPDDLANSQETPGPPRDAEWVHAR